MSTAPISRDLSWSVLCSYQSCHRKVDLRCYMSSLHVYHPFGILFPSFLFLDSTHFVSLAVLQLYLEGFSSWTVFVILWGVAHSLGFSPGLYRTTTDLNQMLNVCMVVILVLYVFQLYFYIASLSMPSLSYTGCDFFLPMVVQFYLQFLSVVHMKQLCFYQLMIVPMN